jgi:hypothetical protein
MGLSTGEAMIVGTVVKALIDVVSSQTGRKVTIDELPQIIADEEVRRLVLDKERAEVMGTLIGEQKAAPVPG